MGRASSGRAPRRPTSGQRWDPERYARTARYVAELAEDAVALLAARPGERILDLGCGDGVIAERLAAAGCAVVGVDASAEQVAAARARGLDARVMDGHALAFDGAFDAVFSNAALHWMVAPEAVIDGVWRALRPGGRFVGEMGGAGNVAVIRSAIAAALGRRGLEAAAYDPWYFPTPEDYRGRLERRGFRVRRIELVPRPTPVPGDFADWLETFAGSFLAAVPEAERPALMAEVREAVRPRLCDAQARWTIDYVRLRFAAVKPADAEGRGGARPPSP